MLKAEHIKKTYNAGKKVALDDFSIHVPKASIYGLLGPNGAGKTSFIRIINQITQADSGDIFINGQKLNPNHIKDIGYMPEERGLYKNMTVGDQILYFGELKGMTKSDALNEAKKWFEKLNIDQWWKKKLSELSKGMAQKIQFVVTVLHRPHLLILDEPFSGFDPVNANLIKDQIIDLKNNGTTIILSTHRMESVEEMCDYVALINNSKKIIDGRVFDVREKFKKNIFGITLSEVNNDQFENFRNKYEIFNLSNENNLVSFDLKNEESQNNILLDLVQVGKVRSFDERIPSMNEVFINAVSNHS
ncbi:Lipopolysaccharide export system ATP-binding protein LptB [Chryseobacterium gleum]|uniref:Lipopolysaccharide export system ATP-binding protein LptB n=2 Tax=Chryseobacterium gleum TaxID=250 RepID=A0A448B2P8_CHRGE|nr:ATP-binding cassette domain-containing protein [Chryseobacterium gleum]EFK33101.1 ABC transporter, ATP-binding protein [Chryseobacterium gleum ATCC 35910]MCE4066131.1 ATP-binding cassette domain-containing protein [Chryseobacterium gleum]QBJ86368.1 ATP-binding cassette domain-containing protein [Chryseobacterium gleum]QQY33922.1 ATP-binding cassette domain-containing protein [Chryseobacterium gleum]VEE07706.1 Lipopolysaccharide export system ATP-binding protein LptB [Chryseobacterium gleum]